MKTIKNLKAEEIRKSILQLAIQGKLVKQDSNDEPASELVKRIYAEKQKLIQEGKIKKDKNESFIFKGDDNCYYEKIGKNEPVKLEDLPFDIPENWTWVRLKSLFEIRNGFTPLRSEAKYWEKGTINWFTVEDIHNQGHIITSTVVKINKCACTEDRIVPASSLLLCCTASIGEYALTTIPLTTNQQFNGLSLNEYSRSAFNISYLLAIAPWFKSILLKLAGTTTFPFVSTKKLENVAIPLPPINEQTRIVNKINSFEPLIAKYSLTEEKLTKLEQEFPEKLKKSILQYAIEGKLVKQDPNDEPASVLLERIKAEKEKLIKEGKIKRDKNESYIYQGDDKNYYEKICLRWPSNWVALPLKSVLIPMQSCKPQGEYFRYIDIEAVDNKNQVISNPKIMRTKNAPSRANRKLHTGDVIFSIVRPYLKNIALISENYSDCIGSTGFYVCSPLSELNSSFLY